MGGACNVLKICTVCFLSVNDVKLTLKPAAVFWIECIPCKTKFHNTETVEAI